MRRDIASSLGEGSPDAGGMEELRGENPRSIVDAISNKGGLEGMVSISNKHKRRNRRVQRGTFVQVDVAESSPRWG
jgi:hypothetical protein